MVSVENLIFEYPSFRALKNVSFTLEKGSVTALVGPNGAGKTTLLRCLASLNEPYSGNIIINGIDIVSNPQENHRQTGYLSDFFGLYEGLTIRQNLLFIGSAQKVQNLDSRVNEVIALLGLDPYADKDAKTLSRGWRQRLGIAMAMIHNPAFLILDEPASGLDPEARIHLSSLIKTLNQSGITLLISSHILAELEDYSSHLLVMSEGRIVENKKIGEKEAGSARRLKLHLAAQHDDVINFIYHNPLVSSLEGAGTEYSFLFSGDENEQRLLLKELVMNDVPVLSLEEGKVNLQDEYLKTISKEHAL